MFVAIESLLILDFCSSQDEFLNLSTSEAFPHLIVHHVWCLFDAKTR